MSDEPPPVRVPITGELDLHTFQPREVASVLDEYLAACQAQGILTVRVVHGKGTGTIRELVRARLRRSPLVESFRGGDEHTGNWGATVVRLRPRG
jgi:DNA-nicking Smr family endonuclease